MLPLKNENNVFFFRTGLVVSSDKIELGSLANFHIDKLVNKQVLALAQRLQAVSDRNTIELVKCK